MAVYLYAYVTEVAYFRICLINLFVRTLFGCEAATELTLAGLNKPFISVFACIKHNFNNFIIKAPTVAVYYFYKAHMDHPVQASLYYCTLNTPTC